MSLEQWLVHSNLMAISAIQHCSVAHHKKELNSLLALVNHPQALAQAQPQALAQAQPQALALAQAQIQQELVFTTVIVST
jgi:ABC-type proline/glycine betaine transport system ATPase subunit